eukprot:810917-Prymnesium_polylepis.1
MGRRFRNRLVHVVTSTWLPKIYLLLVGTMSSACALALVATVTPSAFGGCYYLARAQPDRPPDSSMFLVSALAARRRVYAARHPHAAAGKRCSGQLPWSLLA